MKSILKNFILVFILFFTFVGVSFGQEETGKKCYNFSGYENKEVRKYIDFAWNVWVSEVYKDETAEHLQEIIRKGKISKKKNLKAFTADINDDNVEDIFYSILESSCSEPSCYSLFNILISSKDGYTGVAEVRTITIDPNIGRAIYPICILNSSTNGIRDLLVEGKIVLKAYRSYWNYFLHGLGQNQNTIRKHIESCYKFIDYAGQENLKKYVNLVLSRWRAKALEDLKSLNEDKRTEILRNDLGVGSLDEYIQKKIMKEKGILKLLFVDINNDGKKDIFYFIYSPMIAYCNGKGECPFNVLLSSEKGYTENIETNLIIHFRTIPEDRICVMKTLSSGLKDLLLLGKPFPLVLKAKWTYRTYRIYESIVKLIGGVKHK